MRVLISGIGRSGTTLLYQQIAKCMLGQFDQLQFRYEPYLWSIDSPSAKGLPFDMSQISHHGVSVHKSTPLFLVDENEEHDKFIDSLFHCSNFNDSNSSGYLTKSIRGAGRLEAYLRKYPDLKIAACLRNPIDTINSSLGMFSFLGHEFHADDCDRLFDELKAARNSCVDSRKTDERPTLMEYSTWWWRSMTEETLRVAEKYPSNFYLFVYEEFSENPEKVTSELADFFPVIDVEKFHMGLKSKAGPSIKQNHFLAADMKLLDTHFSYYCDRVLSNRLGADAIYELESDLLDNVANSRYCTPIAGDDLGRCSPTTLRGMILQNAKKSNTQKQPDPDKQIDLSALKEWWCHENHWCSTTESRFRATVNSSDKTFGCVITCHNNEDTIRGTLMSALEQTRPFDQIIIVDDASTDDSLAMIERLVETSRNVKLLKLETNVGVSAARHFGIVELETDFITHLDGDDYFWPSKNFHEANVVCKNPRTIGFSDILIVEKERQLNICTAPYNGHGSEITEQFLVRREGVPRDMTFARSLYFEAGGYDLRQSLYEDLDFKLKLSTLDQVVWKRSEAPLGTVYNRKSPTLSRNEGLRLSRALTAHFFRHVGKTDLLGLHAAEAYNELLRHYPSDWTQKIFDRLQASSGTGIAKMGRALLSRQMEVLDDEEYVQSIDSLCRSNSFDVVAAPWKSRYGMSEKEGPYAGFNQKDLFWQVSKSCGFSIQSRSVATGVRGLLYVPHIPEQKLSVVIEQSGRTVQKTFDIAGRVKDEQGNHVLQEIEIPMPLGPGETKISCFATSRLNESTHDRELYCLFADWQLYC
ncbi:MAG: glycosyltransferase [Planctomycetota bacterium]